MMDGSSWITLVGLVLTSGAGATAALFAYLTTRTKLQFDADAIALKASVVAMTKAIAECEADKATSKAERLAAQERADKSERQAARMEGEFKGAERELQSLRSEVNDLRDRLKRHLDKVP